MKGALEGRERVIVIDTWGSKATSKVIEMVPAGSHIILLGNVSEKRNLTVRTTDISLNHKCIEGFNLIKYMCECLSKERREEFHKLIRDDITKGGSLFLAKAKGEPKVFKLEQISEALDALQEGTQQQILLDCHSSNQ